MSSENNADYLMQAAMNAGIRDPKELANFMGQMQVESGDFASLNENLNYSGERLLKVFPGRNGLDSIEQADRITAGGPKAVANAIYGGDWGAIATEPTSPSRIGAAQDLPTKGQAEQAALAQCAVKGGQNCKVKISYGNGCAALIANDTGYQANADVTVGYAVQTGMQMCSTAGHGTCHVVYSACSQQQPGS